MEKGFILLKDKVGEKSESIWGGIVRRVVGRQPTTNILKGELLEQIPGDALVPRTEGQNVLKPYNYRLVKDPAVAVYCSENDIAPLSDKEFLLLEAIQSVSARYEVFIVGNKVEWGCGLKPGDPVYVSIPGATVTPNQRAAAVIRYIGGQPPDPGLMFGIEITVSYPVISSPLIVVLYHHYFLSVDFSMFCWRVIQTLTEVSSARVLHHLV